MSYSSRFRESKKDMLTEKGLYCKYYIQPPIRMANYVEEYWNHFSTYIQR